jgi:cytochrome c biogenesis protein
VVLKKIKRLLVSPKTTILLIIIFLAACITGITVPQITEKSPSYFDNWKENNIYSYRFVTRLQLHRVFTSIWFLGAISLTLLSLGYSLYRQIKKNLGQRNASINPEQNRENLSVVCKKIAYPDDIKQLFRNKGYRITSTETGKDKFIFSKNSLGRWGSTVLHMGIFLVILSAFFAFAFQKRGFVQIIRGDIFSGDYSDFLVKDLGVFAKDFSLDFTTRLSLLNHTYYESDEIKKLESIILVDNKKGSSRREVISPNEPLDIKGVRIYQSYNYGYTLTFMLKKPDGQEVITHFNLDMTKKKDNPLIGKSDFPTTPYIFEMKFLPDLKGTSFFITKPIVYLTIFEMITKDTLFNGLLLPKHSIKINDDILSFIGITEWSGLIFTHNPGMTLSYFGFALIIIGAIVMFGFPYKEVSTSIQKSNGETVISAYVHTMRYPATFKEDVRDILEHLV